MKRKNLLLYKKFLIGTFVSVIGANLSGCGKTNEYVAPKNGTIAYSGEINYSDFKTIKLIKESFYTKSGCPASFCRTAALLFHYCS